MRAISRLPTLRALRALLQAAQRQRGKAAHPHDAILPAADRADTDPKCGGKRFLGQAERLSQRHHFLRRPRPVHHHPRVGASAYQLRQCLVKCRAEETSNAPPITPQISSSSSAILFPFEVDHQPRTVDVLDESVETAAAKKPRARAP